MVLGSKRWVTWCAVALAVAAASPAFAVDAAPATGCEPNAAGKPGCPEVRLLDAASLLAFAKTLPAGGGNSSTGPGGATLPGSGGGGAVIPIAARPDRPLPNFLPLPPNPPGRFRPNEVMVLLQPGATPEIARALAQQFNLQLETYAPSRLLRTALVRFRIPDGRPIGGVVSQILADPRVRASQRNFLYKPADDAAPRKSALPQYALDVIRASAAQTQVPAGRRPVVAIIDTGIDETHPDLAGAVRDRFDAVGDGKWDVGVHGTGIAGIIAARGQLLGVAPDVQLLSVRAFASGEGDIEATTEALIRGLDWAVAQHADVINMSLAGPEDQMMDVAVGEAIAAGAIVVAAAGNEGTGAPPAFPGAVKGVVAVTATDQQDGLFSGANRGAYISVAAPGVDILTLTPGGGYGLATGTSQAAAEVSGVMALLRTLRPDLTPAAALALIGGSSKDLGTPGPDADFGAGRVDAASAIEALGKVQQASQ